MTGGKVVVLEQLVETLLECRRYRLCVDEDGSFNTRCNTELVHLQTMEHEYELQDVYNMLEKHVEYTNSAHGKRILAYWEKYSPQFVKVIPKAYLKINTRIQALQDEGLSVFDAQMMAFDESNKEAAGIK
jgi:glutamate synthase (NADPH/NADH) large chain/glutamate synthase (ferredoxin)